jgi:hypothetical protein
MLFATTGWDNANASDNNKGDAAIAIPLHRACGGMMNGPLSTAVKGEETTATARLFGLDNRDREREIKQQSAMREGEQGESGGVVRRI